MTYKKELYDNFRIGLLDILILKIISCYEETYGYEIMVDIKKYTNGVFEIREGSLYGPLLKLEKRNFCRSQKKFVGEKRFRTYYKITDLGKQYLQEGIEVYSDLVMVVKNIFDNKYNIGSDKNE